MYKIKVSELMDKYSPIYPNSNKWNDTIEYMKNSEIELNTINLLIKEFEKNNNFKEPVLVSENKNFNYISDGTHRVVAAFLNNPDNLIDIENIMEIKNNECTYSMVTEIKGFDLYKISDDEIMYLQYILRSIKINDDIWITAGGAFSNFNNSFSVCWDKIIDKEHFNLINNRIEEIVSNYTNDSIGEVKTFYESY